MSDDSNLTSTRGRQRLYATSSEKVGAFRERHKEAGYLRKEVLVREVTATRLTEIAKEEDASVMNTASALLELGLAHYESLKSQSSGATQFAAISGAMASGLSASSMDTLSAGACALNFLQAEPAALRSLSPLAASAAPQDSSALLVANTTSELDPGAPTVNPITSFFQKRKQNVK